MEGGLETWRFTDVKAPLFWPYIANTTVGASSQLKVSLICFRNFAATHYLWFIAKPKYESMHVYTSHYEDQERCLDLLCNTTFYYGPV